MAWNIARYEQGVEEADDMLGERGLEATKQFYANLDGSRAVDEYEVGFKHRLLKGIMHKSFIEAAKWFVDQEADADTKDAIKVGLEAGVIRWKLDPYHDGVVGLVWNNPKEMALIVVYLHTPDWETGEALAGLMQ